MPSERRLHPLSVPFGILAQARVLVVPALVVLVSARNSESSWELWAAALIGPYAVLQFVRWATMRYRLEADELVIRKGVLFASERHLPYARIQSTDVERGPLHRLFGVVEVRLQSGGGGEAEAVLRVLSDAAYEELRARIAGVRGETSAPTLRAETSTETVANAEPDASASAASPAGAPAVVLVLGPRELLIGGLLQARGSVILAALFGLAYEFNLLGTEPGEFPGPMFGSGGPMRVMLRETLDSLGGDVLQLFVRVALVVSAVLGVLVGLRFLAALWYVVRLWNFRLTLHGGDLRVEFGLLTQVATTVPLHRVQTVAVFEGPLQRMFGRVSVRVETAGGNARGNEGEQRASSGREWIAPILPRPALGRLLDRLLPELDFGRALYSPVHVRGAARARKKAALVALLITGWMPIVFSVWLAPLVPLAMLVAALVATRQVRALGYAVTRGGILQRRGWIFRSTTAARLAKIQVVGLRETPFDRRAGMSRLAIDTARAGAAAQRVEVPYLGTEVAEKLRGELIAHAARTEFGWE